MMTGAKIAASAAGIVAGTGSALTGTVIANVPALSSETSITTTLGLITGGVVVIATCTWKVARAWAKMEDKMRHLEERLAARVREEHIHFHGGGKSPPKA